MDEQNKKGYEDCICALDELIKIIIGAHDNCKYEGKDCRGAVLYRFEPGYDADLAYERIHSCVGDISEFLHKQLEPPKSHPDYKKEVFDLISSNPIPGVASIEVNETRKKFVVHYKHSLWDRDPTSKVIDPSGLKIVAEAFRENINNKSTKE